MNYYILGNNRNSLSLYLQNKCWMISNSWYITFDMRYNDNTWWWIWEATPPPPLRNFQGGWHRDNHSPKNLQGGHCLSNTALDHGGGRRRIHNRWFHPGSAEPGGALLIWRLPHIFNKVWEVATWVWCPHGPFWYMGPAEECQK